MKRVMSKKCLKNPSSSIRPPRMTTYVKSSIQADTCMTTTIFRSSENNKYLDSTLLYWACTSEVRLLKVWLLKLNFWLFYLYQKFFLMAEGNYQTSRTLLHIKDIIEVCLILHYSQVMTHDKWLVCLSMQFANVHNGMEVKNNVQREGGTCRFANIPFPQDQHLWKKQLDPPTHYWTQVQNVKFCSVYLSKYIATQIGSFSHSSWSHE